MATVSPYLNFLDNTEAAFNFYKSVFGGVSSFVKHSLIDEYHLFINPVVLGNGLPIWKEINDSASLKRMNTTVSNTGIVVLCYQPAT
ncbi:MAG: dihydrofolate reductase family protein [Bacteroidota bacterium]